MVIKKLTDISIDGIDLILLDLDNTIYSYDVSHEVALNKVFDKFCNSTNKTRLFIENLFLECRKSVKLIHKGKAASHSRLFYFQLMVEKLFAKTDINLILETYNLYWDSFINEMEIYEDAKLFLQKCYSNNTPIIIVTDMTAEVQFKKIIKLDIEKYLNFIVTSDEAGIEKPNEFIFKYAIEKFISEVKSINKIIMIGDDQIKDNFLTSEFEVINYHLYK
jgi:putative hydrolase of the HAD superfamily